jgi:peptidoglycan/xylan/chitin deacetylase (PgdA/CDA1 family)
MSLLKDYFSILGRESPRVSMRSIHWNVFTSSHNSIRNLSKLMHDYDAKFTFFIVGALLKNQSDYILKLADDGHEIASHGFFHNSYCKMSLEDARNDLIKSIDAFRNIGIDVHGFRSPYLDFTEEQFAILKGTGIKYTSNGMVSDIEEYENAIRYKKGIHKITKEAVEIPITAPDDWYPIVRDGITDHEKLFNIWKPYLEPGNVFLLHPIRVGNRKFIEIIDSFHCLKWPQGKKGLL